MQATPGAMLDAVAEAGSGLAEVDLGAVMPSGRAGRQRQAGLQARDRRARARASAPATAAWPASSAGASSSTTSRPSRNTPASSTASASSWPWSTGPTSSSTSRTSRAASRRSDTARGRATTGSTSSGKGGDERPRTSRCLRKAGIDVGDKVVLQFYPPGVEEQAGPARGPLQGPAARRDPGHPVQRRPRGEWLRIPGPRPGNAALTRPCLHETRYRLTPTLTTKPNPELKTLAWPPSKFTTVRDACSSSSWRATTPSSSARARRATSS